MPPNGQITKNRAQESAKPLLNYKGGFLAGGKSKKSLTELQFISMPIPESLLTASDMPDPVNSFMLCMSKAKEQFEQAPDTVVYFSNHNCKTTDKIPSTLNLRNHTNGVPTSLLAVALEKKAVVEERTKNQRASSIRHDVLLGDAALFREFYLPSQVFLTDNTGEVTSVPVNIPSEWGARKDFSQNGFTRVTLSDEFLKQVIVAQNEAKSHSQTAPTTSIKSSIHQTHFKPENPARSSSAQASGTRLDERKGYPH